MTRAGPLLALAVLVAACLAAADAAECTTDSFGSIFLDCQPDGQGGAVRSRAYFQKEACSGGEKMPDNEYGIPCTCDPGQQRIEAGTCQACTSGKFNAGGVTYDTWHKWNSTEPGNIFFPVEGVTLYCEGEGCSLWSPDPSGTFLTSGDHTDTHAVSTSLVIRKNFILTGDKNYVEFQYRVSAELCHSQFYSCDGLSFFVDNDRVFPDPSETFDRVAQQLNWAHFKHQVSMGMHTLKWTFQKDNSISAGEDRAYLQHITLAGAIDVQGGCAEGTADLFNPVCYNCPSGKFSTATGATNCTNCGWFTSGDGTGCSPCEDGKFAYPGQASCTPLPNCTADDYVTLRSPIAQCTAANNFMYDETSFWRRASVSDKQWVLCQPTEQAPLPAPKKKAGTCSCEQGQFLDTSGTTKCTYCAAGKISLGNATECQSCSPGEVAIKTAQRTEWSEPIAKSCSQSTSTAGQWCTDCAGEDCASQGWGPGGAFTTTGRTIGDVDMSLGWQQLSVYPDATVEVVCSIDCRRADIGQLASPDDCYLSFSFINASGATPAGVEPFNCTKFTTDRVGSKQTVTRTFKTTKLDSWTLTATFHQRDSSERQLYEARIYSVRISKTGFGGAASCESCHAGQKSTNEGTLCEKCPAGASGTNPPSDKCTPCTGNTFSHRAGDTCQPCGNNSQATQGNTGCTATCRLGGKYGDYDFNPLASAPDGDMTYAGSIVPYYGYPPPAPHVFYLNPCTTKHSNAQCLGPNNVSLPYMACQETEDGTYDLGSQVSYTETARGEITMVFSGGEACSNNVNRKTTVYLICKDVGHGTVGKHGANFEPRMCEYEFQWETVYACPACVESDFIEVWSRCKDNKQTSSFVMVNVCSNFSSTAFHPSTVSKTQTCVPPTPDDIPPQGHVYIVASTRVQASEQQLDQFPSTVASALDNVYANQVVVIGVKDGVVTFRIDHSDKDYEGIVNNIKSKFNNPNSQLGQLTSVQTKTYSSPKSSGLGTQTIAGIVLLVLVLIAALVFVIYKNRQLKYANYRLLQAGGSRVAGGDLYDDQTSSPVGGTGVTFHNYPEPDDMIEDNDDFDPRN